MNAEDPTRFAADDIQCHKQTPSSFSATQAKPALPGKVLVLSARSQEGPREATKQNIILL